MKKTSIDYFYSAYSAYAYIGHSAFLKIAKEADRSVIHRPFDLMKCLNAIGYHPLEERTEAKLNYQFSRQRDRWSEYRNVLMPKDTPSTHSNGAEIADLVLLAAIQKDLNVELISSHFMHRHWTENLDLNDENAVAATLGSLGFNEVELLEAARTSEIGKEYDRNTQFAIEHSVFGSPTYFVDDDMFYGQDNLVLVEKALKQPFG